MRSAFDPEAVAARSGAPTGEVCPFPSQLGQGVVLDQAVCAGASARLGAIPFHRRRGRAPEAGLAGPGSIPTDCSRPDSGRLCRARNGWADSANGRRGLWTAGPLTVAASPVIASPALEKSILHVRRRRSTDERKRRVVGLGIATSARGGRRRTASPAGTSSTARPSPPAASRPPRRSPPDRLRGDGPRGHGFKGDHAAAARLLPAELQRTPTPGSPNKVDPSGRSRSTDRRPTTRPRSTRPGAARASTPR